MSDIMYTELDLNVYITTDKVVVDVPQEVISTNCSKLYDLMFKVTSNLGIKKKDIRDYIEYEIRSA